MRQYEGEREGERDEMIGHGKNFYANEEDRQACFCILQYTCHSN